MGVARQPPKLAEWLLSRICKDHLQDEIIGDLYQYHADLQQKGAGFVSLKYWYHTFQFLRPFALKPIVIGNSIIRTMIKLNFIVAYRSLLRNKFYSFINIFGLGLGLATCILIGIFIKDELSYDRHWQDIEYLYRVSGDLRFMDNDYKMANSPAPMAKAFKEDFPEIMVAGRFRDNGSDVIKVDDIYFNQDKLAFADPSMLDIFKLTSVRGVLNGALDKPDYSIIDETTANKLFGTVEAVGKTFELYGKQFQVRVVYQDIPDNSHFHFPVILSMEGYEHARSPVWLGNNYKTYFKLNEQNDYKALEGKFESVYKKYFGPQLQQYAGVSYEDMIGSGSYLNYTLIPVADIHLYSDLAFEIEANGNIQYVYILMVAGFFVLMIASINFMNISTARSSLRAKEVGMRKVMGSVKRQLIFQFMIESIMNAFLALTIAVVLTYILLPFFNELTEKTVTNPFFGDLRLYPEVLLLTVLVGILAGLYPAFFLSKFQPIRVLKGQLTLGVKSGYLRNTLVIIQFLASIMLIFGSLVIYSQLRYTQTKSLGFEKDQVIIINETHTLGSSIESFRNELLKHPATVSAAASSYLPTGGNRSDSPVLPEGANTADEAVIGMQNWLVDENYIPTLQLKVVEGRNFSKEFAGDTAGVILNQSAVKEFGFENPVGQKLHAMGGFSIYGKENFVVVGVIEDFHFDHFKNEIGPLALFNGVSRGHVIVQYQAEKTAEIQDYLHTTWEEFNPERPLQYTFMDQQFEAKYKSEEKLGSLFGAFAIFSITIACLGLFGLAAFSSDQRKKEIGVRKVLGASTKDLMLKQVVIYSKLLVVALAIGLPLSHYLMNSWLSNFAYSTTINWLIYTLPALLVLIFAWTTVSVISYRAATQNPVENLKQE